MPEKYESKISSLEETKNLTNISFQELVNALQAREQRRLMRHEKSMQGLFKQVLNTQEGAKTRDSTKRKRLKITKTRWRHIYHVHTVKKQITSRENIGGDQILSVKNMVRLDILKESANHNMKKKQKLLVNNLKRSSCLLHHVF